MARKTRVPALGHLGHRERQVGRCDPAPEQILEEGAQMRRWRLIAERLLACHPISQVGRQRCRPYALSIQKSAQAPNETAVVLQRASRVIGGREALFKGVEMRLDARR